MGFYFRRAAKIGPFRLNLSKSGVGMSGGIKGLRAGKGLRGNYIHMTGPMGVQYRQSLNGPRKTPPANPTPQETPVVSPENVEWIESGDVDLMRDAQFEDILNEINMKYARPVMWVIGLVLSPIIATCVVSILESNNVQGAMDLGTLVFIASFVLSIVWRAAELKSRAIYLIYDIDRYREEKIQKFYDAFDELKNCAVKWHVVAHAELSGQQSKVKAGASEAIQKNPILIKNKTPKYFVTNVAVPCIPVGKQELYFFPDRILIVEKKKVGTVNYADLIIEYSNEPVVQQSVPADAEVIDRVWKYANKKGGPDQRYKDNVQLPVCNYSGILFRSETGLNEKIMVSKPNIGSNLATALKDYIAK